MVDVSESVNSAQYSKRTILRDDQLAASQHRGQGGKSPTLGKLIISSEMSLKL